MPINDVSNAIFEKHPFVFCNPCGVGYMGGVKGYSLSDFKIPIKNSAPLFVKRGSLLVAAPKYITYGLEPGSGDWIGWESIIITPDLVGKKIAVFLSCEAKTVNDRIREDQIKWFNRVYEAGGIAELWKEKKDGSIECYTKLP